MIDIRPYYNKNHCVVSQYNQEILSCICFDDTIQNIEMDINNINTILNNQSLLIPGINIYILKIDYEKVIYKFIEFLSIDKSVFRLPQIHDIFTPQDLYNKIELFNSIDITKSIVNTHTSPLDNFDNVYNILPKDFNNNIYIIQHTARAKEIPIIKNDMYIKSTILYNKEDLLKYKEELIDFSNKSNTRIYISINHKSPTIFLKDIIYNLNKLLLESNHNIYTINPFIENSLDIISFITEEIKKYVVPWNHKSLIDYDDECVDIISIKDLTNEISKMEHNFNIIHKLKTKNGLHLITTPLSHDSINYIYDKYQIHSFNNRLTLLYCNT